MVHVQQQHVLVRSQAQQLRAQQRTRLKVEGLTRVCCRPARARVPHARPAACALRSTTGNATALGGSMTCTGSSLTQDKARAQRLVTRHHLVEAALQRRDIELSPQPPQPWECCKRHCPATAGPETTAAAGQTTAAALRCAPPAQAASDLLRPRPCRASSRSCRQSRHRRDLEQAPQRQIDLKSSARRAT